MTKCTKCLGEGLIGSGENPELKQGAIKTCDLCAGTGILVDGQVASENQPTHTREEMIADLGEAEVAKIEAEAVDVTAEEAQASSEPTPEVPAEDAPETDPLDDDGSTVDDAPEVE